MYEEAQKEFKTKVMQKEEERNESGFEEIQKQQDMAVNATRGKFAACSE